jgi:hypothetical protein
MNRFFLLTVLVIAVFIAGWYLLQQNILITGSQLAGGAGSVTDPSYHYTNATKNDIFVTAPEPAASVTTTIIIEGYARGPWYFEGTFPVEVKNAKGVVIGTGQGKAEGEWTSNNFAPFTAEVDLKALYNGQATIVLKKDNPSGNASKDASLSFPVLVQ